jgi:L-ascorbate metabolism protein UlaG (beta-lactamase superfamily)
MTVTLTWYGHATFGMKTAESNLLIDPYFTGNPASPVKATDVTADYILVSHGHGDHVGDSVEIAKRCDATIISNAEISAWLRKKGVNTHAQHIGGGHQYPFGYLKLTLALHGSSLPDGSDGGNPAGFLLTTTSQEKIYFAGDTGLFGDMRLIGEEGLDIAILPIGDNYTMGPDDALRAVKMLNPKEVIPMHYNTFGLIQQDPYAWSKMVESETDTSVHVMHPGENFVYN